MAEVGLYLQPGIKNRFQNFSFSILSDFRLFGFPQITAGLITGFTFGHVLSLSFNIGGGFSNPKFTSIANGGLYQPYFRGMFSVGIINKEDPPGLFFTAFYDYYFDYKDLYDHNFRAGIGLSIGNN